MSTTDPKPAPAPAPTPEVGVGAPVDGKKTGEGMVATGGALHFSELKGGSQE